MKLIPLNDYILIEKVSYENVATKGGILLTGSSAPVPNNYYKVITCGSDVKHIEVGFTVVVEPIHCIHVVDREASAEATRFFTQEENIISIVQE